MKRSLYLAYLASLALSCMIVGCGSQTNSKTDGGTADMAGSMEDPSLCSGAGCIGAPCATKNDCTEGNSALPAVCWNNTLLDNAKFVVTPGGYCSRECSSDSDCGTGKCMTLPGATRQYCMAKCSSATRCRKPGYSCAFDGTSGGVCFPNANFDCNPTASNGICEYGVDKYVGGCIRVAFESDKGGVCHIGCQVGARTCPPDAKATVSPAPAQLCVYLDTTQDEQGKPSATGDKFKGNVCFQQPSSPVASLAACNYWTDCGDGYQCDRLNPVMTDRVCRQICAQGNGMQPTIPGLYVPAGALPANNTCSTATEGCANSLRAGTSDGAPGLCQPKKN